MAIVALYFMMLKCSYILIGLAFVSLGGCATAPAKPLAMAVPFAGEIRPRNVVYPFQNVDTPRGERVAQGPAEVSAISAYTEFTYDYQRLNPRHDGGYRASYQWRQVVTSP